MLLTGQRHFSYSADEPQRREVMAPHNIPVSMKDADTVIFAVSSNDIFNTTCAEGFI